MNGRKTKSVRQLGFSRKTLGWIVQPDRLIKYCLAVYLREGK